MLCSLTARPLRLSLAALSLLAACVGVAAQDAGAPEPSTGPSGELAGSTAAAQASPPRPPAGSYSMAW